jgi:hypothetical protein
VIDIENSIFTTTPTRSVLRRRADLPSLAER